MYYTFFKVSLFEIYLVGDAKGITRLYLDDGKQVQPFVVEQDWQRNDEFFIEAVTQVREYLEGTRRVFDLVLNPEGTVFQKEVWKALMEIPYGQTVSYKDIGIQIGNPKAARAVGMANNKNPIPIIIPCHRVIGASGKLTGYAFGIGVKAALLELEMANTNQV